MQLIHGHLRDWDRNLPRIRVSVDRHTLARRRWRGTAEDGAEFGFDLEHPLKDGEVFAATPAAAYAIAQKSESVLEVALHPEPGAAARLGWTIGNLHFSLQIEGEILRVADDPALRQLFEREAIAYAIRDCVFKPLGGGHSHHHH